MKKAKKISFKTSDGCIHIFERVGNQTLWLNRKNNEVIDTICLFNKIASELVSLNSIKVLEFET